MSTKRQRKVTFNNIVVAKLELHYNDYTEEEKSASWYRGFELNRIRNECKKTMRMMHEGRIDLGGDDFCTRGLVGREQKSQEMINAQISVLQEQRCQKMLNYHDPEKLAEIYMKASYPSWLAAYATGLSDREFVDEQEVADYEEASVSPINPFASGKPFPLFNLRHVHNQLRQVHRALVSPSMVACRSS